MEPKHLFEFKLRILGNELFAVSFGTNSDTNRSVMVGIVAIFSILTVVGAYGEKFAHLYRSLAG